MYYRTHALNALGNVVWAVFFALALILLTFRLERKNRYFIRIISSLVMVFGLCALLGWGMSALTQALPNDQFVKATIRLFNYTIIVSICGTTLFFCYRLSVKEFLFFTVAAFSLEHIGRGLLGIIRYVFKIPYFWGAYGYMLVDLLFISSVIVTVFLLFLNKRMKRYNQQISIERRILFVSLINLAVCVVLPSYDSITLDGQTNQFVSVVICNIYSIFMCCCCLFLQINIYLQRKYREDKRLLDVIIKQQNEQKTMSAENVDFLNTKLHDIKKQISLLEQSNEIEKERCEPIIKNIKEELSIFDTLVKTGNLAIDSIISSNYLVAAKNDVDFTYFVDGSCLNFIQTEDTMALFNNLLSNALEAVNNEQKENKVVHLEVYQEKQMVLIDIRNYSSVAPTFKKGLPVTSKDTRYHGYGMKSI